MTGTPPTKKSPRSVKPEHRALIAAGSLGTLTTIKRDGRPQLSQVSYAFDPDTLTLRVSVTDGRAKTRNLRRDPRASMLVLGDSRWSYAVGEGTATLGEVTTDPGDAASDALVDLYRTLAGEHPDWDEYRRAMIDERRLVLTIVLDHSYGIG